MNHRINHIIIVFFFYLLAIPFVLRFICLRLSKVVSLVPDLCSFLWNIFLPYKRTKKTSSEANLGEHNKTPLKTIWLMKSQIYPFFALPILEPRSNINCNPESDHALSPHVCILGSSPDLRCRCHVKGKPKDRKCYTCWNSWVHIVPFSQG